MYEATVTLKYTSKWDHKGGIYDDEIPDPVKTATAILDMVQYYDEDRWDLVDGSLAESFKEFYKLEDK